MSLVLLKILNHESFIRTDLICCDGSGCNKAYHATCAGIEDIKKLPETWYCPSCTIRSRISANNVQSQSKVSSSAEQEAGSTAAASPDVPSSIAVKKDTAYDDDTDEFESCKSSQSSQAQVDHKAFVTKGDEDDGTAAVIESTSSNNVNHFVVEGGGVPVVNGTYIKIDGHIYHGAPVYTKRVSSGPVNCAIYL